MQAQKAEPEPLFLDNAISTVLSLYNAMFGHNFFLKGQFYKRNYRKITILRSISHNSLVKCKIKIFGGHNMTVYIQSAL